MGFKMRDQISVPSNISILPTVSLVTNQSYLLTQSVLEDSLDIEKKYISPRYVFKRDNSIEPTYSHDNNTCLLAMAITTDSHVKTD